MFSLSGGKYVIIQHTVYAPKQSRSGVTCIFEVAAINKANEERCFAAYRRAKVVIDDERRSYLSDGDESRAYFENRRVDPTTEVSG